MEGWIKIHRKIQSHWLWNKKPFSPNAAWIDMVMLANHKPGKVLFNGKLIHVERGSFVTSQTSLKKRWGWKRRQFDRFLNLLTTDGMMYMKNVANQGTYITICNYSSYND